MVGLLIPLMHYVSACQCNSGGGSPIALIIQTLEILELMNIGMVKDGGEHCYHDQGVYLK